MRKHIFTKRGQAAGLSSVSARNLIRRGSRAVKNLPRTLARALRQPSSQYRIALWLATIMTALFAWTILLSTLPHTLVIAFIGHF